MAGDRLPHSLSFNSSSAIEIAGSNQTDDDGLRAADGAKGSTWNDEAGPTGKGGKLRLSRPSLFRKRPYDRPVHPGALNGLLSTSLNASLLVDSASNLIVSSASYLFESFFKRRKTLWIGNGPGSTVRKTSTDMEIKECSKPPTDYLEKDNAPELQGPALEACREKVEGEDSDLVKVEGILKQSFLSREEVKRLTDVLQKQTSEGHVVGSNLEDYRWGEKIQQVVEEPNPVQLAKAYMGKHTSHGISMTSRWQSSPYRYGERAGPSSIKRTKEDVYKTSPLKVLKSGLASAERMLKRRLIADDDDNVVSKGSTRRVRQKMTIMANSSPYIRQLTVGNGPQTSSTPLLQLKERTKKVDEALEEPRSPVKGTSLEEPAVVVAGNDGNPPESSKAWENLEPLSKKHSSVLPTASDADKSSCMPVAEHVEPAVLPITSNTTENSAIGLLAASPSELPAVIPDRSKGFHMSAFFEDSSSDEESGPALKMPTSMEAQQLGPSITQGALKEDTQKHNDGLFSSAPESTNKASPSLLPPSNAAGPLNTNSSSSPAVSSQAMQSLESPSNFTSTLPIGRPIPLFPNLKPLPVVSSAPCATEKEFLPFTPSASARAPSSVVLSMPPVSASPSGLTTLPATSISVQGAAKIAVSPSSSLAEVEKPSSIQKVAPTEGVGLQTSGFSPANASFSAITRVTEAPSFTEPTATSKPSVTSVMTAASVSPLGSEPSSAAMPANLPVVFQASTGGAQVATVPTPDSLVKAGGGVTFTSGSPGADRQSEGDIMATDPMTEEPDGSFTSSSASTFLFGSASTVPMPLGQMPSFGLNATSASPFSFSTPSSAPSGASSSAQFNFSSQSSSAFGPLFAFGSSGTPPSNPFSNTQSSFAFGSSSTSSASPFSNTQSSFSFGSSAASSVSPIFTATSSAPVTFPATPATPSFQFGGSSSSSSTPMFGAQMTETAGAFAAPGSQSNSSAFLFSAPPTSTGTPSPPSFQFSGAGASGPSFGGQSFTFGGQPALTASNPFGQSGISNAAPFQFGTSTATPSQSVFPSGPTTPSPLSFGSQQQPSASPFPFTFGAQHGASPTGQPFSFGGQPATPAQSPFNLPGPTGQNTFPSAGASGMDFGGGFSLGAAGGEKSSRKFIKAKRIGGGKRAK